MNIYFADDKECCLESFRRNNPAFYKQAEKPFTDCDVLVIHGGASLGRFSGKRVNTCILPSYRFFDAVGKMHICSAVTCGMAEWDSVSFSSISDACGMICFKKTVLFMNKRFEPCEFRAKLDPRRGLYANLAINTLDYLVKHYHEGTDELDCD